MEITLKVISNWLKWFFLLLLGSILLFIIFLLFGKFWTQKTYDYKNPKETIYKLGRVGGRLNPTEFREEGFQFIAGSPFDLSLWVDLKKEGRNKDVALENLIIRDLETNQIILVQKGPLQGHLEQSTIYFDIKKITKDYHNVCVSFDLTIDRNKEKVLLMFEKDYTEKRINKYLEIMMSV